MHTGHLDVSERKVGTMELMEMLRRVQQGMSVEGSYLYRRFGSGQTVPVTVENIDGEIFVRFSTSYYPVRLRDIPMDATFELIE